MNQKVIADHWRGIIHELGLDLDDPNFADTPDRVARTYVELFEGIADGVEEKLKKFSVTFPCDNDQMIVIKDIECWGMCPHHFLPVRYNIAIGYIPHGTVLGLSKLPRLASLLAKRPVLQEQMTKDIGEHLQNVANPKGVIVRVVGEHLCMKSRGIRMEKSSCITSYLTGIFKDDASAKSEFLKLVN